MHTQPAPNVVPLPRWLPAADAARALGIAERTLRHRAERGAVQRRRDGRAVLYLVTAAIPAIEAATPATETATETAIRQPATVADTAAVAALVNALQAALERAARAELAQAATAAELERAQAVAADLAQRLIRRGELLRRIVRARQ